MIFIYIILILLFIFVSYIYSSNHILSILFLVLFIVLTRLDIIYHSNFYKKNKSIPRFSQEDFYNECGHGDIICISNFNQKGVICFNSFFNYRFCHCVMIIEKNHQKYVVEHDYLDKAWDSRRRHTVSELSNLYRRWVCNDTLLIEYLKMNFTKVIHLFKYPTHLPRMVIPKNFNQFEYIKIGGINVYYCTLFVSKILLYNKIIQPSTQLFPYRTNELLKEIEKIGYKSYLFIVN